MPIFQLNVPSFVDMTLIVLSLIAIWMIWHIYRTGMDENELWNDYKYLSLMYE